MKKNNRILRPLNDFQVFKGKCEQSMKAFGGPLMAQHEASFLIREDQSLAGGSSMYAIYRRSENRILQIIPAKVTELKSRKPAPLNALDQVRLKFAA